MTAGKQDANVKRKIWGENEESNRWEQRMKFSNTSYQKPDKPRKNKLHVPEIGYVRYRLCGIYIIWLSKLKAEPQISWILFTLAFI